MEDSVSIDLLSLVIPEGRFLKTKQTGSSPPF